MNVNELKNIQAVAKNRLSFWQTISQLVDEKIAILDKPVENFFEYDETIPTKQDVFGDSNKDILITRKQAAKFLDTIEQIVTNLKDNGYLHLHYTSVDDVQKYSLKELQELKNKLVIPKDLINSVQAALLCKRSPTSIRYYVNKKFLTPNKIFSTQNSYYFKKSDVEKLAKKLKAGEPL